MKTDKSCPTIKPEILTGNYLETTINRNQQQFKKGYLSKCQVSKLLGRSRQTLHTWDQILINTITDYANYWQERKYNHYQLFCLMKLSRYQSKERPYKAESDLISYIERNLNNFTLETYLSQF